MRAKSAQREARKDVTHRAAARAEPPPIASCRRHFTPINVLRRLSLSPPRFLSCRRQARQRERHAAPAICACSGAAAERHAMTTRIAVKMLLIAFATFRHFAIAAMLLLFYATLLWRCAKSAMPCAMPALAYSRRLARHAMLPLLLMPVPIRRGE